MDDLCPACDTTAKPFRLIQRATEQEFRGGTLRVTSPALQCRHCGFGLLGSGYLDALRVATHDTYRRQHGLLTSGEIAAPRKAMGLSQKRFAEFLRVGSASIEPIKIKATRLIQDQGAEILYAATRELLIHSPPAPSTGNLSCRRWGLWMGNRSCKRNAESTVDACIS